MSDKRPRIGVIGSTNMDLTTTVERMPVWGETVLARRFETSFGGKGANQAVAAAKLGADVVMVTNLGDDALGLSALKNFEDYGIDTGHVRRIANQSTGTATILVDAGTGDNAILIVAGANGDLSSADVDAASEALKRCDLILLQLEIQLETAYAAIRFGAKNGVRTVLNPAPARREPRHGSHHPGELPRPQRDRACDHDRHAGRIRSRGLRRRAEPRRPGGRDGHRHARRARRACGDGSRRAGHRAGQGRGGRHHRRRRRLHRQPSPAISPAAFRSTRRSPRRPAIPPSRSRATGRRNPIRPRPSSRRSAPGPADRRACVYLRTSLQTFIRCGSPPSSH